MKVFFFPVDVDVEEAMIRSPGVFRLLSMAKIEIESGHWDGTLDSLPMDEHFMVRASSSMHCTFAQLGRWCLENGCFAFYQDHCIGAEGNLTHERMLDRITTWLQIYNGKKKDPPKKRRD